MSITLSDGTTPIALPADLLWPDKYSWSPVVQESGFSLSGALIIETATKLAGRPITLESLDDQALVSQAVLDQLNAWNTIAGQTLTLTIHGASHTVIFDHAGTAIEAIQITQWCEPNPNALYRITLRFMEI